MAGTVLEEDRQTLYTLELTFRIGWPAAVHPVSEMRSEISAEEHPEDVFSKLDA